ncbi:peroxiredoxin Q/BCP [Filomicrobium insigne]|uniref:thioredoxin-dependent peroxiredoxin n=1 Tax=Filomicrobium insigne TaxID=418854 RepID=A0A1H0LGH9_9HYPH|nr:thioredoxin-dependent thiol peroxidase [Filomicrobium insigne]SDO67328.1 peroxiredoxin Q/BCP [Filomicrobium insigne]
MAQEGDRAPDFELSDSDGNTVTLSDLKGQQVVLYFYPKDDTPGCTTEALDFTALSEKFANTGTIVLGISPDSPSSHCKFRDKHGLTVRLISDPEQTAANAYGIWVEKNMYGRKFMGIERSTFLINKNGKIARIWRKVKVKEHAAEVLAAAQELAQ